MKIATAAYPMEVLADWEAYTEKLTAWVREAADNGADLLVFPEYGAMELATLSGAEIAADLEASLKAVAGYLPAADRLHAALAQRFKVHILAASAPVFADDEARPVNRARLFAPSGEMVAQDKQIMTRFEREIWHVDAGEQLQVFDTALGKIGILICYDSEFPLLGRALSEADILLVPSCTDTLAGYWRVRIGAMARALENQCVCVMASTVGDCDWSPAVDENVGAGGVFGPPDAGFPDTGILALGELNTPGWTYAEVSLTNVRQARETGAQFNRRHWIDQETRCKAAQITQLR
ncbi:(R)-stereoselective amidase [Pelagimonas phthalicica]|uniref:(R)-stereoselective amidase n=1 Tax=Pelagimonas phthalicica TaxID=1037362 RepID=A0A238JBV0_9RHOB|nr:carbon-nitrogen hydrolase family protein [Pelagimonas phthalicica]TDS93839.1 putative amidohydrolase [Pelagimonas phthalicica]SMX27637.1 (R)-stereoselective amidase [Pelagimonas phthalicica]